jgi:predicted Mrr-cat superfamily restriction endonuclease
MSKIWVISAGNTSRPQFTDWRANNWVRIGFSGDEKKEMPPSPNFSDFDDTRTLYRSLDELGYSYNAINDCLRFRFHISKGELIVVRSGLTKILGVARINSNYRCDGGNSFGYRHYRTVEWEHIGEWEYTRSFGYGFNVTELPSQEAEYLFDFISMPSSELDVFADEIVDPLNTYPEGAKKTVTVNRYERSRAAKKACIEAYGLVCCVCDFDFAEKYGALGEGLIHVHHLISLSEINTEYQVNPITDLRPICPNCHMMIHSRSKPPYSIDEVKNMITDNAT